MPSAGLTGNMYNTWALPSKQTQIYLQATLPGSRSLERHKVAMENEGSLPGGGSAEDRMKGIRGTAQGGKFRSQGRNLKVMRSNPLFPHFNQDFSVCPPAEMSHNHTWESALSLCQQLSTGKSSCSKLRKL